MAIDVGKTTPAPEAEVPDWSREAKRWWQWAPSRSLLASIRSYQRVAGRRAPWWVITRWVAIVRHRFWGAVSGADIPLNCRIGGGLLLPHPNGVVIHADVEIGHNCLIFQQVTLGATTAGIPRIGVHVDIGAGAKVLGPIIIGHGARIGANAVVLISVPNRCTAVGVPARVVSTTAATSGDAADSAR